MIPATTGFLDHDFEIEELPSKTYKMDLNEKTVRGFCDGLEAMKQAIFRNLNTERYEYVVYPWYYGIETLDLFGLPLSFVCPEIERRITEALMVDTRIRTVSDFEHDTSIKGVVHTTFTVHTIYGDVKTEKEVNI